MDRKHSAQDKDLLLKPLKLTPQRTKGI